MQKGRPKVPLILTTEERQRLDDDQRLEALQAAVERLEGGKTFDFSYSFSGQWRSSSDNYKEVARKSETRRITNPDDPDQFVDIRRATEIRLVNENDPKLKRRYRFQYPDGSSS
mgnify:CR=1 FL=1